MRQLTVASYNIHSGIGTDHRFDLHRIGEVLKEINADVVALQEVGDFRGKTAREDHVEHLADMLGVQMVFGPTITHGARRYGNAVLSKLPIIKSHNYDLSVKSREPRGALRCDLDMGEDGPLHLFCLHLGLRVGERRAQEALLVSADILRDAVREVPVVVCGDFNYWWSGPVPALVRQAIHDVAHILRKKEKTFPSRWPVMRLDRMFVDHNVRPLALHPHRTSVTQVASDHLPLVMRFEAPVGNAISRGPVEMVGRIQPAS